MLPKYSSCCQTCSPAFSTPSMFATNILDLIDFSESEISLVKEKMLALPPDIFEHDATDSDFKRLQKYTSEPGSFFHRHSYNKKIK